MCAKSSRKSRQKSWPSLTNMLAEELANLMSRTVSAVNKHKTRGMQIDWSRGGDCLYGGIKEGPLRRWQWPETSIARCAGPE